MANQIKLNPKWRALFESKDNYFVLTGGRGSGKSFSLSFFALSLISSSPGHRVAVYRATMVSASASIMQDMKDMVPLFPNAHEFEIQGTLIKNTRTGSEIFFKGIQTARKDYTASLKGLSNCSTFILDEAEELTDETLWDKIDDTFRGKNHQIRMFVSLNPTTREHWIYQRFFEDNEWKEGQTGSKNGITYIHTTFMDNIDNIEDSKVEKWLRAKKDRPDYYKHTIMGGWRDAAEGVIFPYHYGDQYDQPLGTWLIGDYEEHSEPWYGLDFGSHDPSVLIEANVDRKNKILYVRSHFYLSGMVEDDILVRAQRVCGRDRIIADSASAMHIDGLRKKGLNIVPAKKGPDSIMKGIELLKGYRIVVDPSSKSVIREFRNYIWSDSKADYPDQKGGWDHAIDALRYPVFYNHMQRQGNIRKTVF